MEETHGKEWDRDVEFVKGCPICEHSDPELERRLEEFARWLYEVMRADQKRKRAADAQARVDKLP